MEKRASSDENCPSPDSTSNDTKLGGARAFTFTGGSMSLDLQVDSVEDDVDDDDDADMSGVNDISLNSNSLSVVNSHKNFEYDDSNGKEMLDHEQVKDSDAGNKEKVKDKPQITESSETSITGSEENKMNCESNANSVSCETQFKEDHKFSTKQIYEEANITSIAKKERVVQSQSSPETTDNIEERGSMSDRTNSSDEDGTISPGNMSPEYQNEEIDTNEKQIRRNNSTDSNTVTSTETEGHINKQLLEYECKTCMQLFENQAELTEHVQIHLEEVFDSADTPAEIYGCDDCPQTFTRVVPLKKHMKSVHGKDVAVVALKRNMMQKNFTIKKRTTSIVGGYKKTTLINRTGTKGDQSKNYPCEICGKCFATPNLVKRHSVTHSDEKPWECEVCGNRFGTRDILKAHMQRHTGEKKYECDICHKRFTRSFTVTIHKRSAHGITTDATPTIARLSKKGQVEPRNAMECASGEEGIRCNFCDKAFPRQDVLAHHIKSQHLNEKINKDLRCNICGKTYTRKDSLVYHIRSQHSLTRDFQCEICNKLFAHKRQYERHVREHQVNAGLVKKGTKPKAKKKKVPTATLR